LSLCLTKQQAMNM